MESNENEVLKDIQKMCKEISAISQDFYKSILIAAIEKEGVPKSNLEADRLLSRVSYLQENAVTQNINTIAFFAESFAKKAAEKLTKQTEETAKKQSATDEFFN